MLPMFLALEQNNYLFTPQSNRMAAIYEALSQKSSTMLVKARWKFSNDALWIRDMSANL
jgi:hypothetical protein